MPNDQNAALQQTLDALKSLGRRGRVWMLEHYDTNLTAVENIRRAKEYFDCKQTDLPEKSTGCG